MQKANSPSERGLGGRRRGSGSGCVVVVVDAHGLALGDRLHSVQQPEHRQGEAEQEDEARPDVPHASGGEYR